MQRFEGQVQLVLYPFALNPTSEVATQAAWCAGEQGKFWEFHHMLYRRQELDRVQVAGKSSLSAAPTSAAPLQARVGGRADAATHRGSVCLFSL